MSCSIEDDVMSWVICGGNGTTDHRHRSQEGRWGKMAPTVVRSTSVVPHRSDVPTEDSWGRTVTVCATPSGRCQIASPSTAAITSQHLDPSPLGTIDIRRGRWSDLSLACAPLVLTTRLGRGAHGLLVAKVGQSCPSDDLPPPPTLSQPSSKQGAHRRGRPERIATLTTTADDDELVLADKLSLNCQRGSSHDGGAARRLRARRVGEDTDLGHW